MLLTTYNPNSTAGCPCCQESVKCQMIGGVTFGSRPYLDFYHEKCGTEWRYYLNEWKSVVKNKAA